MIFGSDSGTIGGGEGSGGGGGEGSGGCEGGDEPIDSKSEPSDSEDYEEDEEEEDMVDQNLEWMMQGPLALPGALHRMPKHSERTLTKYDPANTVKVEDHLDKLYLYLQTLRGASRRRWMQIISVYLRWPCKSMVSQSSYQLHP